MINRLVNFSANIFLSNFKRLAVPYKLTYAITYKCNSRCKICNIWKKKDHQELSDNEIKKFFQSNTFFNWIDITGGEVFLRPNLVKIITEIIRTQRNLYLLHIPTNGIMTEKIVKNIEEIVRLRPNKLIISISLDGPRLLHDNLRGIKGNWDRAILTYKKITALKSNRLDCYFGMTISGYNYSQIEETYQEIKNAIPNFNRDKLHFNIAHHSSHYYENQKTNLKITNEIINNLTSFNKKKKLNYSPFNFLENKYQSLAKKYITTKKTPIPCEALSSSIFLNPKGDIYPCIMWNNKLGNISDFNFKITNLWKDKKIEKALKIINRLKCPNCWTPCEAYQSILGNLFK